MNIDPNSIPIDQSLNSLGAFILWFSIIIVGIIIIGVTILSKSIKSMRIIPEDDSPIPEPNIALVARKQPVGPPEDDTVIVEEVEEEPFTGIPV